MYQNALRGEFDLPKNVLTSLLMSKKKTASQQMLFYDIYLECAASSIVDR